MAHPSEHDGVLTWKVITAGGLHFGPLSAERGMWDHFLGERELRGMKRDDLRAGSKMIKMSGRW